MRNTISTTEYTKFGKAVLDQLSNVPFGSLSKSELEYVLFRSYINAGLISVDKCTAFSVAEKLQCTTAKAASLIFNYHMRSVDFGNKQKIEDDLLDAIKIVTGSLRTKDNKVTLNVGDRFWREYLKDQLRAEDIFTDTSFNNELVIMDADQFITYSPSLFGTSFRDIQVELDNLRDQDQIESNKAILYKALQEIPIPGAKPLLMAGSIPLRKLQDHFRELRRASNARAR